jgi:glycopeptide antibiotics resistance protein
MRFLLLTFLLLFVVGILYYSWIPSPSLASENYLPLWLRNWSNIYFNLRTAVPFVGLGFLLEVWTLIAPKKRSKNRINPRIVNIIIAVITVSFAETGQFFLVSRHPDSMDLLFGIMGSVLGIFLFDFTKLLFKTSSTKNA